LRIAILNELTISRSYELIKFNEDKWGLTHKHNLLGFLLQKAHSSLKLIRDAQYISEADFSPYNLNRT